MTKDQKKILKEAADAEFKLMKLMTKQLNDEMLAAKKYQIEFGDMYQRYKDTLEIKLDATGMPQTISLPSRWVNQRQVTLNLAIAYETALKAADAAENAGQNDVEEELGTGTSGSIIDKHTSRFAAKKK